VAERGLGNAGNMKLATTDYRCEMDIMQNSWMIAQSSRITAVSGIGFVQGLHPVCSENGEYVLSNTKFGRDMNRYLNKRNCRTGWFTSTLNSQSHMKMPSRTLKKLIFSNSVW